MSLLIISKGKLIIRNRIASVETEMKQLSIKANTAHLHKKKEQLSGEGNHLRTVQEIKI